MYLTHESIEDLHHLCSEELARVMKSSRGSTLKMDIGSYAATVAWQILVPFVLAVSARLTADRIAARDLRKKNTDELKRLAHSGAGARIAVEDSGRYEECVLVVEELLKPFEVSRAEAREIVSVLASRVSPDETRS
ncbi:MAG: hypothetical protein ACJ8GN_08120 [Longimicrobiaceae bacterium]